MNMTYCIAICLDYILSYMARFMPFARKQLWKFIKCVREYDGEPFEEFIFNGGTGCEDTACPSCNYDMMDMYIDRLTVLPDEKTMKFIKISYPRSEFSLDTFNAKSWAVKCTCPICKTKFEFEDSNY